MGTVTLYSVLIVVLIFFGSSAFLSISPVNAACIDFDGTGRCQQFDDPTAPPSEKGKCIGNCDTDESNNFIDTSNLGRELNDDTSSAQRRACQEQYGPGYQFYDSSSGECIDGNEACKIKFGSEYVTYKYSTGQCFSRQEECNLARSANDYDMIKMFCTPGNSGGSSSETYETNTTFDTSGVNTVVIGIVVTGVVGIGAVATSKAVKSVKAKKSFKNKTKVDYDSSKGTMPKGYGTTPDLLRPVEKKTKTLWVEPPSPKGDNTLYDYADEIPAPTSVLEFTEYLSKHWDRLQNTNWEKYFENVGNCIIEKGGALHTTEDWIKKAKEIAVKEALGKVKIKEVIEQTKVEFKLSDLLKYSGEGLPQVQESAIKIWAKIMTRTLVDELDKYPKFAGIQFVYFLKKYFSENIMASYSCLWESFIRLPVNRLPDNTINVPDQSDMEWKGV